jgi:hypothetical protein
MFIYLDTETTGTEPDDRLCQLAFKTGLGAIVSTIDRLMKLPARP